MSLYYLKLKWCKVTWVNFIIFQKYLSLRNCAMHPVLSFVEKRCVSGKGGTLKWVDATLPRNKPKDLQGFLIFLDDRIECGCYLRFEELDYAAVDTCIFVKSEWGEGLTYYNGGGHSVCTDWTGHISFSSRTAQHTISFLSELLA